MRKFLFCWMFGVSAWGWCAGAAGVVIPLTLQGRLEWAQAEYAQGTNHLAREMYREAQSDFGRAAGLVEGGLRVLAQREASIGVLREQAEALRRALEEFEGDWTGAVAKAEGIRDPLLGVIGGLEAGRDTGVYHEFGGKLNDLLQRLDMAGREAAEGKRMEAKNCLLLVREQLDGQIAEFGVAQSLAGDFRGLAAEIARGQEELAAAMARPFDVAHALEVARECLEEAVAIIDAGHPFAAAGALKRAREHWEDVRVSGQLQDEVDAFGKELAETERGIWLDNARGFLGNARNYLAHGQWVQALGQVEFVEKCFLAPLAGTEGEEYEGLVREAEELKEAAERGREGMGEEGEAGGIF